MSEARSSLRSMQQTRTGEVAGVDEHVLDELAQTLAERFDVLLDRMTDRALATPNAGTSAWKTQWLDRDSPSGREHQTRRLYVRADLASRAGIGLTAPPAPAPALPAPTTPAPPKTAPRRARRAVDADQLTIF